MFPINKKNVRSLPYFRTSYFRYGSIYIVFYVRPNSQHRNRYNAVSDASCADGYLVSRIVTSMPKPNQTEPTTTHCNRTKRKENKRKLI